MKYIQLDEQYKFEGHTGEQRRYNHEECGDQRQRLYVKRTNTGFLFFCHNCGSAFSGFNKFSDRSNPPTRTIKKYEEIKQGLKENIQTKESIYNSVSLPYDFTNEIPYKGVIWLDKYMITEQLALEYNLGYSKTLDRLILPVYNYNKEIIFWQGRNLGIVDKQHPKYKNCRVPGKTICMDTGVFNDEYSHVETVVIVEDILSAIRIGKHRRTLALLGSYISDDILATLEDFTYIKIWLDADKYKTAVKYANRMRQVLNKLVTTIYSVKDPKEYTDATILTYLY